MDNDVALTRITDKWMGDEDEADLFELERVIQRGLATFVEVGNALAEIRDRKLYRAEHKTFEDYCRDRWNIERRQAYRLMDAAAVVSNVSHGTQNAPESERQARPLTGLTPQEQVAVWQEAVETAPNGKVTAAHVEDVVRQFRQPETAETDPIPTNTRATMHSSESNEWYTPGEYIAAVRQVMGDIDLDPASCEKANNSIQARQYFTADDDGLAQDWHGRVFLNPPYGKTNGDSNQATWSDALVFHYKSGNVTEAILLVNATPGNKWFAPLWDYPICFVDHRIRFYNPDGEASQPTHSNCFVYLGPNGDKFARVFSEFGVVAVRWVETIK